MRQTQSKYFSECDVCWHMACDGCIIGPTINEENGRLHDYWLCPCCEGWTPTTSAGARVSANYIGRCINYIRAFDLSNFERHQLLQASWRNQRKE